MYKHFIIFLFLLSNLCVAQKEAEIEKIYISERFKTQIKKSKKIVSKLMSEKSIPGLTITVANKDEIIWAEAFGFSDLENKTPTSLKSKFRIGSISKSLTSMALGKLIEEGKINWNDTVHKLVKYFPKKKHIITIQELASHTAGIRNYRKGEYLSDKIYGSVEESIHIFKEDTLLFEPKTKYSYSTYGYVLLSAAMERATNQKYLDYIHSSLLVPMGLNNTVPDLNDSIIEDRANFYELRNNKIINARYVNNSNKWAGGGFLSTSIDLAKMAQNLLKNEYLNKSTLKTLWTPTILFNGKKTNYCLGWRKDKDSLGRSFIHHGGSSVGGRSFLLIYPDEEIIVTITCNLFARFDDSIVLKIAENFIE